MGRQIHFYMLPDDQDVFQHFVQKNDPVVVIARDDPKTSDVHAVGDLTTEHNETLCLWNRRLLPYLHRKWIRDPGYYRADEFALPILEFSPSFKTDWEGTPALLQGRLYGIFEEKPPEFEKWYERIVRWIRKNYRKNPTTMGGYVGPNAYELFEKGAYLLPQFLPPRTDVWLAEIGKQHSRSNLSSGATSRVRP